MKKYLGIIQVDSTISASRIIDAFMATFQPIQDANIMTKQMRSNSAWGGALSAVKGDSESMSYFASAGDSDLRMQKRSIDPEGDTPGRPSSKRGSSDLLSSRELFPASFSNPQSEDHVSAKRGCRYYLVN
mgnify:CR=1 FL=1